MYEYKKNVCPQRNLYLKKKTKLSSKTHTKTFMLCLYCIQLYIAPVQPLPHCVLFNSNMLYYYHYLYIYRETERHREKCMKCCLRNIVIIKCVEMRTDFTVFGFELNPHSCSLLTEYACMRLHICANLTPFLFFGFKLPIYIICIA